MDWSTNLQMAAAGLAMGSIYALVALGFVLIFNAVNVVNFAQGEFAMVPARSRESSRRNNGGSAWS